MAFVTMSAILGGSVRVGLEDSLHAGRGARAKSNSEQVAKIRRILDELSLTIATPMDAREMGRRGERTWAFKHSDSEAIRDERTVHPLCLVSGHGAKDHKRLSMLLGKALLNAGIETDIFDRMAPASLAARDNAYAVLVIAGVLHRPPAC